MKRIGWLVWLTWIAPVQAEMALTDLTPTERAIVQERDAAAVARYRSGFADVLRYMQAQPVLFPAKKSQAPRLLTQEQRADVRRLWARLLDYYLALDGLGRFHGKFATLPDLAERQRSFAVAQGAFLAGYRTALDFIAAAERNPGLDVVLNEPLPELGLPARTYDKFKFRFLNALRAGEFAAMEAVRPVLLADDASLRPGIVDDARAILRVGRGKGEAMTFANGFDIVRKAGVTTWFPVQAGVAEWMGDVKVYRVKSSLVSAAQIAGMPAMLEPGDVLLERREWYLSNIGLPGYWPHAALYVGTPEERASFFDDPAVRAWVREQREPGGDLNVLLQRRYGKAYVTSTAEQEHGHRPRVIEAISEGVSFTTIEHSEDADAVAVLRPRRGKVDKAAAVVRAFGYAGRPYDFDFDFRSDATLVCTELVYKAYEPVPGITGLTLPLVDILGRVATPANEIARQFDEQYGSAAQQFDLVLFLDGQERSRVAVAAGLEEFRRSWRRPKWHILVQSGAGP